MKQISPAWFLTAVLASAAVVCAVACSSTDGPTADPINMECQGPSCLPTADAAVPETSTKKDATPDVAADVSADVELIEQRGRLFMMQEPKFEPWLTAETPFLGSPARVHLYANGTTYSADYDPDPDAGFVLMVPKVKAVPFMAEDINGANDLMSTVWGADIPTVPFNVAVLPKSKIEQIASSVSPPITLDPAKGHLMITLLRSVLDPTGTAFAKMAPTIKPEAVIYLAAGETWVRDDPAGTGPTGTALAVNLEAQPFPGVPVNLKYTVAGEAKVMVIPWSVRAVAGAVTRVYFSAEDATPE